MLNFDERRLSKNETKILDSMIELEADQLQKEQIEKIEDEMEYGNLNLEHYHYAVN